LVLGRDNTPDEDFAEDPTRSSEPGNQLAGFDIRWTNMWFGVPLSFYAQATAEDEAGGFPSRYMALGGIDSSGYIRSRWSYRWYAEITANSCDALKSPVLYGCAYEHGIYDSGYRYYGRVVGHGAEADARIGSLGIVLTNTDATSWQFLFRYGDLNRLGTSRGNTLTATEQQLASADVQFGTSTRLGRFELGAGFQRLEDPTAGTKTEDTRAFFAWTSP
jgi:hypothetical protein